MGLPIPGHQRAQMLKYCMYLYYLSRSFYGDSSTQHRRFLASLTQHILTNTSEENSLKKYKEIKNRIQVKFQLSEHSLILCLEYHPKN